MMMIRFGKTLCFPSFSINDQAKKASVTQLTETANAVFNEVYTSLDLTEIIELLGNDDICLFHTVLLRCPTCFISAFRAKRGRSV